MSPSDTFEDEFDEPPTEEHGNDEAFDEDAEEEEFDEPSARDLAGDAEDATESPEQALEEYDESLLEAFDAVEQALASGVSSMATEGVRAESAYEGGGNIVGVGLGTSEDCLAEPGASALNVYVVEPTNEDEVRRALVDNMAVHAASDESDLPINIIHTGEIEAQSHRFRLRPSPNGISVAHRRVTAGTQGVLCRGRRRPRRRRLMILSNNHVIANSNSARFGDPILQPGPADGGRMPRDRIAILERFVPIDFRGRANFVDCATGWASPSRVQRKFVYLRGGRRRFFRVGRRPVRCRRDMVVGKSGRTTQLRRGMITDCNATIRVNYGRGRVALFRDQIAIRGLRGPFSAGGDSGSLVWQWNRTRPPVGLLFAGGGGFTFANKIGRVLRALDVSLVT